MTPKAGQRRGAVSLKGKALQWLAQREHSRAELARKLHRWQVQAQRQTWVQTPAGPSVDPDDSGQGAPPPGGEPDAEVNPALDSEIASAEIEQALDALAQAGLLSDERFAQGRVQLRQARFGNRRIEQELRQYGVSAAPEQWSELQRNEAERALSVLRSRFKMLDIGKLERTHLERAKRFLAARGFSSDAIRAATRAWAARAKEDES